MAHERIQIGSKSYRKFIPWPKPVTDGTVRCMACGQIDEPQWHDDSACPAMAPKPRAYMPTLPPQPSQSEGE
jgi:hypothetical protein